MIKNTYMSQENLYKDAQKGNRYQNIHKNFVLPQDNFSGESSYQNSYPKKDVNYNDLRAVIQKPKSTLQNRRFEGQSAYNDSYINNPNFNGKPQKCKQLDNIKLSTDPFNGSSQYNAQLKGQGLSSKTERYPLPRNQIFPKGQFEGMSLYNNSYLQNQIRREPQFRPQGELKIGQNRFEGGSSYSKDYSPNKDVSRPQKITQKNNEIMPKGNFVGESTYLNAYVQSKIQKNHKFVPESELKVGGKFNGESSYLNEYKQKNIERTEKYIAPQNQTLPRGRFQGQSNYNDSYLGTLGDKTKQFKPEAEWKMEGQFEGNSSYLNDFKRYENAKKSSMLPLANNKFMPEGLFETVSNYQGSYLPNHATREPQYRREGELKVGGQYFEGNSSYLNDFPSRDRMPATQKFRPRQNDIMPKGKFEGQSESHQNYIQTGGERGQSFRPRHQLEVGGKFSGISNYEQQYSEKKGLRAQRVPLPINQVMPEGRFDGQSNYANSYIPTAIQRREKIIMNSQLKVGESPFEGNSTYAQNYQYSPARQQPYNEHQYDGQSNNKPRWNKKASRWE